MATTSLPSVTQEPEKMVPKASGSMAMGWGVQWMRSVEVEWPHVMFSHCEP